MAPEEGVNNKNMATKPATNNNNNTRTTTKPNKRNRKIEIKKVQQQNKLHVTFSKRKQGLFNKVTELSFLCEAKTALLITSPNGKFYACGYPNADTVLQRFLTTDGKKANEEEEEEEVEIETLRFQYEATEEKLKEERKKLEAMEEEQNSGSSSSSSSGFPCWWNNSIEDMSLEYLEQFKTCVENLKLNLITAMETKRLHLFQPLPLAVAPPLQTRF